MDHSLVVTVLTKACLESKSICTMVIELHEFNIKKKNMGKMDII